MSEQFDLFEGLKLKDRGMTRACLNKEEILYIAREIAIEIAQEHPLKECSIDEVQREMLNAKIDLGMAAGSVFKTKDWTHTGKFKKTHRKTSHARNISIWRLKVF